MESFLTWIIIGILVLSFGWEKLLDYLNNKSWNKPLPAELEDLYDSREYQRAQSYSKEKGKISSISSSISFACILALIYLGLFGAWSHYLRKEWIDHEIWSPILFIGSIMFVNALFSVPFNYYSTFVIEEKYGFNKMSKKTFFMDLLKGTILSSLIGGSLFYLFLTFVQWQGDNFWIFAWITIGGFSLLMAMFYTDLIVPLFNKLTPLEEGLLRTEIEKFSKKVSFPLSNIYVMDGSKRSTKANAYFSGLGKAKKIVLYDTLIEEHSIEELTAVLAHEVGHFKHKHIRLSVVLSLMQMGLMLYLLSLALFREELSISLGAETYQLELGLIAFTLLYSPLASLTGYLMNRLSRKNEFEADAYASAFYDGEALISALKKLSVKNLSNMQPHPLFVNWHYSHPTLLQRMKAIKGKK